MHCKKNLMLLLAVVALALPLIFTGTASAKYYGDGATQNGTTGLWNKPSDGVCVISIDASGNMVVDNTITNKRDCDARLVAVTAVTSGDTLANVCGKTGKNTAGLKYAAPGSSTCVTVDGSGYITGSVSLVNLDRTAAMCTAKGGNYLANNAAVKNTANGTSAYCAAYGWLFAGQDANGTPLTWGTQGVTQAAGTGFCSASMTTGIAAASCPSVIGSTYGTQNSSASAAFGYTATASACNYAYGVTGPVSAALTKADGSSVAAGTTVDLTAYTTQGACLANGGAWLNWQPNNGTATIGSITAATFDLTRQTDGYECLRCHSSAVQYNGPAERWKDSYLMTGHKNMLRKVTPGMAWAGPDGIYTTDGTNALTWGTLGVPDSALDGTSPMYYIYGDWMAVNPSVAKAGSNYSCANCHSTGFGNGATTGYTPLIPGVQSIGTPGYAGTQPADAGTNYASAVKPGWQWDVEGIQCARCHNATVPAVTQTMISGGTCTGGGKDQTAAYPTQTQCSNAGLTWIVVGTPSAYPSTAPTSGHMGALASGTGRFNLCFGCHGGGSMGKLYNGSTQYSGGTAAGATQYDPTLVGAGAGHGATYGRDGNGHILGNEFLNSPHGRYSGVNSNTSNGGVRANALGENDLVDPNGTTEYNSIFKGYTCWQSPTSNSPAKTKADGTEIKDQATCEGLYGVGSWRADTADNTVKEVQGTCTTCHDVHNSLFVASESEAAIRKTCENCHVDNATTGATDANVPSVVLATLSHPTTSGTPFDTNLYESPCVVCHMATQALANGDQNSMAQHIWRINTSASYTTFPSPAQFYGGTCSNPTASSNNTVANAPYLPAVLKSDTSSANCTAFGGTWTTQPVDKNMQVAPENYGTYTLSGTTGTATTASTGGTATYTNAVWVDLDLACGQCHGGSLKATSYALTAKDGSGNTLYTVTPPAFTKDQLSAAATGIHTGSSTTTNYAVVNPQCLTCHSTGAGGAPVITPGTNHHGQHVACTSCHATPHTGAMAANGAVSFVMNDPSGNAFCLSCHGNTGTHAHHHVTQAIAASGRACQTCHNYGGVAPTEPASNSDCLQCHGSSSFARFIGSASTTSVPTIMINPNFGPGKNHHGAVAGETDCVVCHNEGTAYLAIKAQHNGNAYNTYQMCLDCHQNYPYPNALVPGVSHHYEPAPGGNCTSCHDPYNPVDSTKVTGPGVIPVGTTCEGCHIAGQYGWSGYINHNPIASTRTAQCQKCHDSSGVVSGVTYTNNAGITPSSDALIQVACGQCHGGSETSTTTNGAPYKTFAQLSQRAAIIHTQTVPPTAAFIWSNSTTTDYAVNFDASGSTCPSGTCTYAWSTGETGVTASHTFADATTQSVTMTITDSISGPASATQTVTPKYVAANPTSLSMSATASGFTVSGTYSVSGGIAPYTVTGKWGDGTTSDLSAGTSFSHTYVSAGTYTVTITAIDSGSNGSNKTSSSASQSVTITSPTISGKVTRLDGTTPLSGALVVIKGPVSFVQITKTDGTYSQTGLKPGTYTVTVTKSGYTFPTSPASGVAPGSVVNFSSSL